MSSRVSSRMFKSVSRTWNVFKGCRFECTYCNARKMAETRLKHLPRYVDGFNPRLIEEELGRSFHPGELIFVGYMGDISFATKDEVFRILTHIEEVCPKTSFLFCSKNPAIYSSWDIDYSDNLYLGTTIESNRDYKLSKAPPPVDRFWYMSQFCHAKRKFLSIEPIMDFDLDILLNWVRRIEPSIVEVGVDNYHNHLPEPPWEKVEALLSALQKFVPKVVEKDELRRL